MYKIPARGMVGAMVLSITYDNSSNMCVFRPHLTRSAGPCGKVLGVIAGALLSTAPHQVNGATINARSPALADVVTAITLAKDGDAVVRTGGHRQLVESR